jgi:preprotein translocase subunit YajC
VNATLIPASEVRVGDRVRAASGIELTVTRIDDTFLGRADMLAFVEDSDERWLKLPALRNSEVELASPRRPG